MNKPWQILQRLKAIVGEFLVALLKTHLEPGIVLGQVHDQSALLLNLGHRLLFSVRALRFVTALSSKQTDGNEKKSGKSQQFVHGDFLRSNSPQKNLFYRAHRQQASGAWERPARHEWLA